MNARELAEQIMAEAMAAHGPNAQGPKPKVKSRIPKPAEPKLKLVSDAPVKLDLETARQTNREREAKVLEAERLSLEEDYQRSVAYCTRKGITPPPHPEAARKAMREARLEADRQLRWQQRVDYHGEMRAFHEAAEAEFRENDPLGLWS